MEIQKWKKKKRKIMPDVLGIERSVRNKIYANTKVSLLAFAIKLNSSSGVYRHAKNPAGCMYCVFIQFIYIGEIEAFGTFQSPEEYFYICTF